MTDTLISETTTEEIGFRPKQRTRRVECEWLEPQEGSPRAWAEIRKDIPLGLIREAPYQDATFESIWEWLAPLVIDWNCEGYNWKTGQWEVVPPPAEIGVDAFRKVDPQITNWLAICIKLTYQTVTTDPKAPTTSSESDGTPSNPSEPVAGSSATAKASRRNQKVSA
jgi:hypothetical protein